MTVMNGLVWTIFCLSQLKLSCGQQQFTRGQIPSTFLVGTYYPTRSGLNALQTEDEVCRPIVDHIDRNSARFNAELVTNTNPRIRFQNADSRIMSSRMQSRLDTLAGLYTAGRMTIKKAWSQYPDPELGSNSSLHFEGRTVSIELSSSSHYDSFLKLAIRAAFDWVYYERYHPRRVRLSVIPSNCERNVDVVFMLDRSGSVGLANHLRALNFIKTVVSFFTIGLQYSRVGVVAYSGYSSIQFDLDDYSTLDSLNRAIDGVAFTGGLTNTPAALNHARYLLAPSNRRGARINSEGIPKIAILITDGYSNRGNFNLAIRNIRTTDIQVYAVGIGSISINQLRDIATDPDNDHVFILQNYLDAAGFVDILSATTCNTPAIIDPGDNVTTVIIGGNMNYFQTSCSIFSNKVLVELIDVRGTCVLFASGTVTNPGPLTSNTQSNTTTGVRRRTVTVTLSSSSKVVYIGVQGQTATATFTILVWDQLFDPVDAFINVVEGAHRGETIYEVNRNLTSAASGNAYTYTFIEGSGDGIFRIDPNNGRVFIPTSGSPEVNFDSQRTHNLTVQARNINHNCQIARIRINIRVISNRITFNSIPTLSISEIASIGTQLVQVVATGGANAIQYSIIRGNGPFAINSNNGRLTLGQTLNYETTQSYVIGIRAVSVGTTVNGEIDITINVEDVNESPTFTTTCATQSSGCRYIIAENEAATTLGTIQATDPDLSTVANGMLQYQLTPPSTRFSIDNSGRLRSTTALDREIQSSYTFTLRVSDRCSGCSLSVTTTVRITVTDVNDNAPVFTSNPATIQVSEDLPRTSAVAEYRATDADIGSNAEITFTLAQSNIPFSLSSSGTLSLTGPIDYEDVDMQSYSVTITAANPGNSQTSMTTSTIQILNVNDNTPVISGEPYEPIVAENSNTGTLVTTVTATDGDLGIHGQVRYTIISGNINQAFALNSVTGVLTVNSNIDRESVSSFRLVVRARDRGTPQTREDRTTIAVTVSDVNDNAPIFRPSAYSVQLREDLPVGHNVTRVLATDADQPNTANSNIAYSITSGNTGNAFTILSDGQIQISQSLDFETTPSYSLVVEGRDGGSPAMSSTATVAVSVINVNENPPTLTGDQSVNISESAPVGTRIAVFQAQDQDQMVITLSIVAGNSENKFTINSGSGIITLSASLDYEITTSYTLTIRASDGQQNTNSVLTVQVLDENEFGPEFSGPSAYTLLEQLPAGTEVGTVVATDRDRDSQVTYSFVGQNQATVQFNLDQTSGVITTNTILDREALTAVFIPPSSQVTLQVAAADNGSPSRQNVRDYTITLVDTNDNTPNFSESMYSNQLRENLPAGQEVFFTSATDIDLGSNAEITYSFTLTNNQGSSNPFEIDQATGAITTTQSLDCELQPYYLFSITATDRGSPSRSSTVTGNLTLIDENDNDPQFSQNVYYVTVPEDFNSGETIMTFTATDIDKGMNGEVEYSVDSSSDVLFLEGETGVVFEINFNDGQLFVVTSFNYERNREVNVTVFASDKGIPRRSTSALLVITVTNVDETQPSFSMCDRFISVNENVNISSVVGTCQATDSDTVATGNQLPIRYSLRGTSQFSINPANGEIMTTAFLDRESQVNSNGATSFTVDATDLANQTSSRVVRVSIADVNDNAPQFSNTPYSHHFTDSLIESSSQAFLTLEASDPDAGNNAMFTLTVGNVVRTTELETQVEIIARDNGVPSMNSSTVVTVTFESLCQLQKYTIANVNMELFLSAQLLCSVAVFSSSLALTLGMAGSFNCRIFGNTLTEIQWLHNGSVLTNTVSVQRNNTDVSLILNKVQPSSAGQYACKILSDAGNLQSVARQATIQVTPMIIAEPRDTSAELGSTSTFKCIAVGMPTPVLNWLVGTKHIGSGRSLSLSNVNASHANVYTCRASNNAGMTEASARLVVYERNHIVQIEIVNINNPNRDKGCHFFDPLQLEAEIKSITKHTVMVVTMSGSNLCELSPCSPSPCQNSGTCSLMDVTGGYECTCQRGYTGVNCTEDVNECIENPCGDNGVCNNTQGSFNCFCNQNFTGRTCQLEKLCSHDKCSLGERCLEAFSGYECKSVNSATSVVVSGASVTADKLTDLVQLHIDQTLQALSANPGTTSRRKRQISTSPLSTSCQPNFVPHESNKLILLWTSCPPNQTEPTSEQQQILCSYLFNLRAVTQCKPPNGENVIWQIAPLPSPTSVKVNLVFMDNNNKPIEGAVSVKILQDVAVQKALAKRGIYLDSISAPESPQKVQSNSESTSAIAGSVGGIAGLILLILIAIVLIIVIKKRIQLHNQIQIKKKERANQVIQQTTYDTLNLAQDHSANVIEIKDKNNVDNDYCTLQAFMESPSEEKEKTNTGCSNGISDNEYSVLNGTTALSKMI